MLSEGPACHVIKMNVIEECHNHLVIIVVIVIKNHHSQSYQNAQDIEDRNEYPHEQDHDEIS